jgi:glycosyltransferase involved in cell wall biosynthesis
MPGWMDKKYLFSIIIPTYNRPERLQACLESLSRLDYPRDRFEVIIVDDGSSMSLAEIVAPFQAQFAIELIRQANAGPAAARNHGSERARGQFLAFTDDDCQPDPNWLTALARGFTEFPDALLGGHTVNQLTANIYAAASQLLLDYIYAYYNTDPDRARFFASNNFALAATQFDALGRFDTTFPLAAAEDREFCDRCVDRNYQLVYIPAAKVNHAHHLNFRSFWRQHFNYGRGAFHFHQIRADKNLARMKVEPRSFYVQLLTYPLRHNSVGWGLVLASLFFVSQVANVAGFGWERATARTSAVRAG